MIKVPIQRVKDSDAADLEKQIARKFYHVIFAPIIALLEDATPQARGIRAQILNASEDPLIEAMRSGRVQYDGAGGFSGKFSVAISRALRAIGGKLDQRTGMYRVPVGGVPHTVTTEAAAFQSRAKSVHQAIRAELDAITQDLDARLAQYPISAEKTLQGIQEGFRTAAEAISVAPKLGDASIKAMSAEYMKTLDLPIKEWGHKATEQLREAVEKNAVAGGRFDRLIDVVKNRYGVTASKARFLSRNETQIYMSKYRQHRFEEAGIRRYIWSTSHDSRVRSAHAKRDGLMISWDQPPLVDRGDGKGARPMNPGEDYQCRCIARPVVSEVIA